MRSCPFCGGSIQDAAIFCKHCRLPIPLLAVPASTGYDFAAIDLETTGFDAARSDRIVEVAVARFSSSGELLSTYSTLVNPKRDVGPTRIHGITATDVVDAPTFEEIAGDLGDHLAGAIICGHNISFDTRFLEAEYQRCGNVLPARPSLCTLRLAGKLKLSLPNRKLATCCKHYGIDTGTSHSAESDAKAAGLLLFKLLDLARERGMADLGALGCHPLPPPGKEHWPAHAIGAKTRPRTTGRSTPPVSYVAQLVSRLPLEADADPDLLPYLEVLDRILEDRVVSEEEARSLEFVAAACGITKEQAHVAHAMYFNQLVGVALGDGVITPAEDKDLRQVSTLLGVADREVEAALSLATHSLSAAEPGSKVDLQGNVVCFTGELQSCMAGEPITRERAIELAERAGMKAAPSLTKKVDILVAADPNTQSAKAKKAQAYGTRIISEQAFWQMIGQDTD